jgi:flagellar hook-associated protein 2
VGGGAPSGGTAESLGLSTDAAATQRKLQTFVDAYNAVMSLIQSNLSPADTTDRGSTLAGSATVRALQGRLQALISSSATGQQSGVRALADLGLKTGSDGTLSIDPDALGKAISRDAAAVNEIFSTATTGISAAVGSLATAYTRPGDGLLTMQQDDLNARIQQMDDSVARMQASVQAYKDMLTQQFAAMEQVVSEMQGMGSFLTANFK